MKKSIKTKSLEVFKEFAKKHNYGVFNDAFMSTIYRIRSPKSSEKISDYSFQDLIEAGADKIDNLKPFFQYIKYCLDNNHSDVALAQIIKKNYRSTSCQYDSYVNSAIEVLKPYKKTLFEYVSRPSFLEHSWKKLENVFETLDDQERKTAIFEAMINTKSFQNVDVQKAVYQLFINHIKSKGFLEKYFTKIQSIEEQDNILDSIQEYTCLSISYNPEKIANANLNGELQASELIGSIKFYAKSIAEMKELEIESILMEEDNSKVGIKKMNIVCNPSTSALNKRVFDELFNVVSRFKDRKEVNNFGSQLSFFVKEKTAEFLSDKLRSDFSEATNKKSNKVKI